ncbi:hypothetical protein Veis_0658 [Verminephrobacter eiseniae EF01-2]|uniref:Uncharacterized protein n=1 Tax=Verminephrobacter eiseniae (strain EF01-2) TaxID=391735 RepID=A1WFN4_VEREI|nr:hypothetical protein Veis_0658 [Verminephrobacter eiseniae EF01-2]
MFRRARPLRKTTRINGLERNGLKRSGRGWNAPGADVLARHCPLLPGRADAIGRGRLIVATWPKSAAKQRQNVPPARSRTRWRSMSSCHRSGPQKRGRDSGAVTAVTGAPNGQATAFVSLNDEVDAVAAAANLWVRAKSPLHGHAEHLRCEARLATFGARRQRQRVRGRARPECPRRRRSAMADMPPSAP